MRRRLVPYAVALAVLSVASGRVASAESRSAPLQVGVTVVRSCAVGAGPSGRDAATVVVRCAAGAESTIDARAVVEVPSPDYRSRRFQAPTAASSEVTRTDVRVVTINF